MVNLAHSPMLVVLAGQLQEIGGGSAWVGSLLD